MTRYRRFFWNEGDSGPPPWAVPLLQPASLVYRCVAGGWARLSTTLTGVRRLPVPVVSVGNLVVGGTGKTPMALWIARELLMAGRRPAVLLRGYGGRAGAGPLVVSDGDRVLCDYRAAGDESVMIGRRAPGVSVVAGSDRYRTGLHAIGRLGSDCIILDDGFQYVRLHRDLNLLLMDSSRPFGSGRLLPAGTLRESRGALSRADLVVFTRWDQRRGGESERAEALAGARERGFVATSHRFAGLHPAFEGGALGADKTPRRSAVLDEAVGRGEANGCGAAAGSPPAASMSRRAAFVEEAKRLPALLVSGIVNAASFEDMLVGEGFDVRGHLRYADHYRYKPSDAVRIRDVAVKLGAGIVITTEKDSVRLPAEAADLDLQFYAAGLELHVEEGLDLLCEALEGLFQSARTPA